MSKKHDTITKTLIKMGKNKNNNNKFSFLY